MFGITAQALAGQLMVGLINGSFYALLSLGLAIIFGLLNIINFAHGAQYMMGAFAALLLLKTLAIPFWAALVLAPVIVAAIGMLLEIVLLRRLYREDHLYGLLLTFGLALIIEGVFRKLYGSAGIIYTNPLPGALKLGFIALPNYRVFVVVACALICLGTWVVIERTKLGSYLRAAVQRPDTLQSFGINVPKMITLTYGFGVGLAALAGVLAAPIYQVNPTMGTNVIIVVFAVVVIGGLGSIAGAIISGFCLGLLEGMTKLFYPEASSVVVFVAMILVLIIKPAGFFGKPA